MIIMLKGLPGSGKSTWALEQVASKRQFIRINKDDLRAMCHNGKWDGKREKDILRMRDAMIVAGIKAGCHVIVDDTNLHPKHETRLRELAEENGVGFTIQEFDTPLDECIRRDAKRAKPVGEKVIRDMWRSFVRETPEPQNPNAKKAIIVDVDGTLAIMGDRSPYDDHLADIDTWNEDVARVVFSMYDQHRDSMDLIIMSGRDRGRSYDVTVKWLHRHGMYPDMVLMRPAGDTRKDAIVKRELYDRYVRDNYNVVMVFDDRDQVVAMWRDELGLPCMQVNWGNF